MSGLSRRAGRRRGVPVPEIIEGKYKASSNLQHYLILRRARFQHLCAGYYNEQAWVECARPIANGEAYIEFRGEVLLHKRQTRYHLECAHRAGLIEKLTGAKLEGGTQAE